MSATLRSGWLTTGPRTARFEQEFAAAVGARHAVAVNSCTAAMHLAVDALDLRPGEGVLVPTMTFAATAEIVRYLGAVPILVDCDPRTFNICYDDAEAKLAALRDGRLPTTLDSDMEVVGIIPVHVGGRMIDLETTRDFARRHGLWVVDDAAHAFPAAWRASAGDPWQRCGERTADISCFSFYANKTITTGEGGMALTEDEDLAGRMRSQSLHGLSRDAWGRHIAQGSWDYRILTAGFKYNLTDVAAAIGIRQLERAETMRVKREALAATYAQALADVEEIELPPHPGERIHSWHLYQIRLRLECLDVERDAFLRELRARGIGFAVHWRPLHLHPYYRETFGWQPDHLPMASAVWQRTISLPIFPDMTAKEHVAVVAAVRALCASHRRPSAAVAAGR